MEIKADPVTISNNISGARALELFLTNLHMFTPKQREKMIKLLENTILPKYVVSGGLPIEEEWKRKNT